MDGMLIVLEGPDGVGKTTIAELLRQQLQQLGRSAKVIALPGRSHGTLGELVYRIHHEADQYGLADVSDLPLQLLHVAAHADTIAREITPAVRRGETVILDRFWWSTLAYARVAGLSEETVRALRDIACSLWKGLPDAIVFLIEREKPLRPEPLPKWRRLVREYQRLAAEFSGGGRVEVILNGRSADEAARTIAHCAGITGEELAGSRQQGTDGKGGKANGRAAARGFSKLDPAKPSHVYDTYWKFAVERQRIFFARAMGESYTTSDPILAKHKFTNAYRASDRVSQYLIRQVIYQGDQSANEVFFRTLLFKLFNRIDTWELLVREFGMPTCSDFDPKAYGRVLEKAMSNGERIYSAAYIMPSGGKGSEFDRKHDMHLALLARMLKEKTAERLLECDRMRDAFILLRSFPTIGDFLAYQYVTDLNYSSVWNYSEMDFVVPGPGALDGIQKCFLDRGGLTEANLIRVVADRQEREFERLGLTFQNLWGRPLQLIDCQNLFCEISKYARIAHPEIAGISNRTRIKQVYSPNPAPIVLWYPPKWGLNDRIPPLPASSKPLRKGQLKLLPDGET